MDLSLTEDQEMLKKVAADFVKAEVPAHQMTQWYKNKQTFQPQLVKKAAELGWLGMMLPEQFGGSELGATDCAVVFEELGAWARTRAALYLGDFRRANDPGGRHGRTKKNVVAATLQRRIDHRAGNHR
jgi:alkylation response protein AidB-like acyl-CoA dehydrogenase